MMTIRTDDRAFARGLPERFERYRGAEPRVVLEAVRRRFPEHPSEAQEQLAARLGEVLGPVLNGEPADTALRDACEATVQVWLEERRRAGGPAAAPTRLVRHADRLRARGLPDEFLALTGAPERRIEELVLAYWRDHDATRRRALVKRLLGLLLPLTKPGSVATEDVREACEAAVVGWVGER